MISKLQRVFRIDEDFCACVRADALLCVIKADETGTIDNLELTMTFAVACGHILKCVRCLQEK